MGTAVTASWPRSQERNLGTRTPFQQVMICPDSRHVPRILFALLIVVAVAAVSSQSAAAEGYDQLAWHARGAIDSTGLTGLSCPSASLCVGVDAAGYVVSTNRAAAGARAWKRVLVDTNNGDRGRDALTGVACPSASLCVAVDSGGNVLASRHPRGKAAAWTLTPVDTAIDACPVLGGYEPCHAALTAISCPSMSRCVAVDSNGRVLATTDPGAASSWSSVQADTVSSVNTGDHELVKASLTSLACPTVSLCVAGDDAGNVITSTHPTGTARAWKTTHINPNLQGGGYGVADLSCPSVRLCVAVDGYASDVITATRPTRGSTAWKVTRVGNDNDALSAIWCPSSALCVAANLNGSNVASTQPTVGAGAWIARSRYGNSSLSALACPSRSVCDAVSSTGVLLTGTRPKGSTGR